MSIFYIARHGETENNRVGRLSGWIDTPLTAAAVASTAQATAKLQQVSFDAVYSSDIGRAFITAYVITRNLGLRQEIIRLRDLREVNYGDAANMWRTEAYKLYPQLDRDTHFTPPGGESLHDMQARVLAALAELHKAHRDGTVLLVAHSGTVAAIRASFTGQDFGQHNISEAYPHDYVAKITMQDGKITSFDSCQAA